MSSFSLSGGVEVLGFISPTDTNDTYAVIDPLYGVDGLRNVDSLSDLNNIPSPRRRPGMVVGIGGGTSYYKLNNPPWNNTISDWSIFNSGGGSGDYLSLSGGTVTGGTVFTQGLTANTVSATTYLNLPIDLTITGFSYSNNTFSITNNSGNTLSATINNVTGLTVNGTLSATTYQNLPTDIRVTGGTYSNGAATFTNNTGGTFNVVGFYTGATDVFVTGGTYSNGTATFTNNTGGTFNVTGLTSTFTGGTVSGNTVFQNGLTATTISATTYQNLPTDVRVTGGTYTSGTATFTNNTGGTFNVTGFTDTFVTGATFTGTTLVLSRNENQPDISAPISTVSLSGALSSVSFNIATSGSISATTFSGGTFIGNGSGLTGVTDYYVTGGTFNAGTLTLNRQNGSLTVTGFTSSDTFVTGFSYSNNVFTINRNQGQPNLTATINTVTGWTINGNLLTTGATSLNGSLNVTGTTTLNSTLSVVGNSALNGGISSTSLVGSTDRVVQVNSGGTVSASIDIISAYISTGSTAATQLSTTSNWDINGVYTGTTITGTYQGQKHYDSNYYYEAVADNLFIRLIRG